MSENDLKLLEARILARFLAGFRAAVAGLPCAEALESAGWDGYQAGLAAMKEAKKRGAVCARKVVRGR